MITPFMAGLLIFTIAWPALWLLIAYYLIRKAEIMDKSQSHLWAVAMQAEEFRQAHQADSFEEIKTLQAANPGSIITFGIGMVKLRYPVNCRDHDPLAGLLIAYLQTPHAMALARQYFNERKAENERPTTTEV